MKSVVQLKQSCVRGNIFEIKLFKVIAVACLVSAFGFFLLVFSFSRKE